MPKEKPICFFCHLPVNREAVYYVMKGPGGKEIIVHGHIGVEKNGGVQMLKGKPYSKEHN